MTLDHIRNFSIIAHIDHGKSTLADRLLEFTGAVSAREKTDQILDSMDLERERGITIKASPVCLSYRAKDGKEYKLNLIDTPGHVDFTYEVSRSLAACEGALLVVDAAQGVEAQTVANVHMALDHNLEILPVINKIDLPSAEPERVRSEIEDVIGLDASNSVMASAKEGIGTEDILEGIIHHFPPPKGDAAASLRALIVDSRFDPYHGAVVMTRVFDATIKKGTKIRMMASGNAFEVLRVGVFSPVPVEVAELRAGEVGFFMAGIKEVAETQIGDTVTTDERPSDAPLPGFKPMKPMVFSGLYPTDSGQYQALRDALEKLRLNDSSFTYEPETSQALGFGFRCGFLGLLHMDIVRERLEREFGLSLIATAPSVAYMVTTTKGELVEIDNPADLPTQQEIAEISEPYLRITILTPSEYTGTLMELCQDRRGDMEKMEYLSPERLELVYTVPLAEVVIDFFDQLKSRTKGYASLDYEPADYRPSKLVKVDVLLNAAPVDAFSTIVHADKAYEYGKRMTEKLRVLIPRQMFDVPIQAAIGGKIIARETVKAKRKDVLAKCYGGDITRKRKLLEKQKEGKKKMKSIGRVEVPGDVFISALRLD